jgi:AraC-like DNA-binding protein
MQKPFPAVDDPLAAVLHRLRLSGSFYCRSQLGAPWGLFMPPMAGCMWFHAVLTGEATLEPPPEPRRKKPGPLVLRAGDFALVPHGRGHTLRSDARVTTPNVVDLPQEMVSERYALLRHGGKGATSTLICGVVQLDESTGRELERLLPSTIHVRGDDDGPSAFLEANLRWMAKEARQLRPGGEAVMTRLSDVLVIQALRVWLESEGARGRGWLGALRDPRIGKVLAQVAQEPEAAWSVADMARRAAMSRSAFAQHFATLVGETPMKYLTRARMRVAEDALKRDGATVGQLAARLGYRSEAAFARAYKRTMGHPPGSARRQASRPTISS